MRGQCERVFPLNLFYDISSWKAEIREQSVQIRESLHGFNENCRLMMMMRKRKSSQTNAIKDLLDRIHYLRGNKNSDKIARKRTFSAVWFLYDDLDPLLSISPLISAQFMLSDLRWTATISSMEVHWLTTTAFSYAPFAFRERSSSTSWKDTQLVYPWGTKL